MQSHTELYLGTKTILEQLKWDSYDSIHINAGHETQIIVFMCEFDAEHPSWPGAVICGRKTLIGRLLVVWQRSIKCGNRTARVQFSDNQFTVEHLYRNLTVKWTGAKKSDRKRQEEMDAQIDQAKQSGQYDNVIVLPLAVPKCAKCCLIGGEPLKACSICMLIRYCSKECQKADWKSHKLQCKAP